MVSDPFSLLVPGCGNEKPLAVAYAKQWVASSGNRICSDTTPISGAVPIRHLERIGLNS
jgi:hypothetical protein